MKKIDKNTIASTTPPKQKNVDWLDISQNPPVLKKFFNGKYVSLNETPQIEIPPAGIPVDQLHPTPMRDVTEEDLQKLPEPDEGNAFYKAIDLQDGVVPYFIIIEINANYCVYGLRYIYDDNYINYFCNGETDVYFCISSDGKFIALSEEEHKEEENNENPGGDGEGKIEGKA